MTAKRSLIAITMTFATWGVAAGCASFGSADDAASGPADASPEVLSEATPLDGAVLVDAPPVDGPQPADAVAPDGALAADDFEQSCAGWTGDWVSVEHDTSMAHAGLASCKVCLTRLGSGMVQKTVAVTVPASYVAEGFFRSETISSVELQLVAMLGAKGVATGGTTALLSASFWTFAQAKTDRVELLDSVVVRAQVSGSIGSCIRFDDVTIVRGP